MRAPPSLSLFVFLAMAAFCPACGGVFTSYDAESGAVLGRYESGDFEGAVDLLDHEYADEWAVEKDPEAGRLRYGTDTVLWNMERGRILFDAGRYANSAAALLDAETILNQDFAERATLSARSAQEEAEAALTNAKALPYRGYLYEKTLINVYKALDYLFLQDLEHALISARRVDESQREALQVFDDDRAHADQEARAYGLPAAGGSPPPAMRERMPWLRGAEAYPPAYRRFVNPYATLIMGLTKRIRNDAAEPAEVDFRNLAAMVPENEFVITELKRIQRGDPPRGTLYVVFENGMGPRIESEEFEIPYGWWRAIFGVATNDYGDILSRAFVALPKLVSGRPAAQALEVQAGSGPVQRSSLVADMDLVEGYEYERRLPMVMLREAVRVVVQETATHEVRKRAKEHGDLADVLAQLGSLAYKSAVNRADDRSWRSLAANYQFLRMPMPTDRHLRLSLVGGNAVREVELPARDVVVLLVRSVRGDDIHTHMVGFDYGTGGIN